MRARAHAREKVTRIAIIDRPLSMTSIDDSGWKGGSSFLHRLLSFCFRDTNRAFLYLSSRMWQIEWMKRAGKERTKGVRVRRVLTCAGEFLSFFVFFSLSSCYCISSFFFIEEEVNDDTWRKEHFLGKNSSLSFFETGFEYRGIGAWGSFVSIKIESSLLFFWIAETCDNTTSLEHPFAMLSLSWLSALMRSIEETLIGEVRWFLIEIYHWKYHMCLSPYAYFSRRHY